MYIYCVFKIKAHSVLHFIQFSREKSVFITNMFLNITPNTQVESNTTSLLTIDEVEKVQRQRIASFIRHMFQLPCAAMVEKLIQKEKLNLCHGCSKRQPETPFLPSFFLHVRRNAPSYPLEQLLTF